MTSRLIATIIDKLRSEVSFTHIAREVNLSVSTIIRIFDKVNYPKPQMPEVLAIDEFKGNTGGEKYNCITNRSKNGRCIRYLRSEKKTCFNKLF